MARPRFPERYLTAVTWGVVIIGVAVMLLMAPEGRRLGLVNIAVPLATFAMLWMIWRRQRRTASLTDARRRKSADVHARLAALSDALEDEYRARRLKSSPETRSVGREQGPPSDEQVGRTIH